MKMSEVFEKCELDVNGYFEAKLEQDDAALLAARHAAKCHDDLVEALELIDKNIMMPSSIQFVVDKVLDKARSV